MRRLTDRAVRDGEVTVLGRALSLLPNLPQPETHTEQREEAKSTHSYMSCEQFKSS